MSNCHNTPFVARDAVRFFHKPQATATTMRISVASMLEHHSYKHDFRICPQPLFSMMSDEEELPVRGGRGSVRHSWRGL